MTGASIRHNDIALNLAMTLRAAKGEDPWLFELGISATELSLPAVATISVDDIIGEG